MIATISALFGVAISLSPVSEISIANRNLAPARDQGWLRCSPRPIGVSSLRARDSSWEHRRAVEPMCGLKSVMVSANRSDDTSLATELNAEAVTITRRSDRNHKVQASIAWTLLPYPILKRLTDFTRPENQGLQSHPKSK
jgi:hypothetical protein